MSRGPNGMVLTLLAAAVACGDSPSNSTPDSGLDAPDGGSKMEDAGSDDDEQPSDGGHTTPGDASDGDGGTEFATDAGDGSPGADAGGEADAGDDATCGECLNGTCEGDTCVCAPGFAGDACEALDEPDEATMLLWFDADHDASFTLGGFEQVDTWSARVAAKGPVVTSAEADNKRPRRLDGQLNGRPIVSFDGVNDSLSSDGEGFTFWSGLDGINSYTLFAVYQATIEDQVAFAALSSAHALGTCVGTGGRDGQVEALHGDATAEDGVLPLQLVSQPDTIELTAYNLVTFRITTDTATLRVNGEEVEALALDASIPLNIEQAIINLGVDSIFYPDARHLGGGLAEVLMFSGRFSAARIPDVENYLKAKWGL